VRDITLKGDARSASGACPTLTFTVEGRTVYTTSDTDYRDGNCKDLLSNGRKDVKVMGTLMSDNRVRARRVTFDEDDD
jgi:hypothetical protein